MYVALVVILKEKRREWAIKLTVQAKKGMCNAHKVQWINTQFDPFVRHC